MNVDPASKTSQQPQVEYSDISDEMGLDRAYNEPTGVFLHKDTLYVAGTRWDHPHDLLDDLSIPLHLMTSSQRYQDALAAVTPTTKRVVGHSLGGAVALELQKRKGLKSITYGAPVISGSSSSDRRKHPGDPFAMFDWGAKSIPSSGWNPHSFSGY